MTSPTCVHIGRMLVTAAMLVTVAVAGCAGPREAAAPAPMLPPGFPGHSAAEVQRNLIPAGDSLYAFSNRARLALQSPEQSGSFNARLVHRRSDSLYMTISPGLGIEAARLLVTPDSFFVYNRIQGKLQYGSRAYAERHLPAALTADDLFANLLGFVVPPPEVDWEIDADGRFYYLRDRDGRRTYVVDPAIWRVVRYEALDEKGDVVEERVFDDFESMDGVLIPRRLTFRQPPQESTASLYYRDVDFNPGALSFDLDVRDSADRVPLD